MNASEIRRIEPATPTQAASAMRDLAASHARVAFAGGGTHAIARRTVDAVVSTSGMSRVLEYAPEDQTITVESGLTFAELARTLADRKQRLALEVADPTLATIGGAIASNAFGPRRLLYGTMKDLILGIALVRADGTPARAGGKVVKNVAGFDLSKLMVGSYGSLALITEATLRVHPLPERVAAFRSQPVPAADVWQLVTMLRAIRLEAAAVTAARHPGGGWSVEILVEGFGPGVEAKIQRLSAQSTSAALTEAEPADLFSRDAALRGASPLRARASAPAADFAAVDSEALEPALATLDRPGAVAYPALGIAVISGGPRDVRETARVLAAMRTNLEARGGSLVIERMPPEYAGAIDPWGTAPPAFALMERVKARFDPEGRLEPGAFVGGL